MTPSEARILFAIPSHEHVPALFAHDLARVLAINAMQIGRTIADCNLYLQMGTYVPVARQTLAEAALKGNYSHIMWLDADMRFPKDTVARLLAHDADIVGANYSTRTIPPRFVAIKQVGDSHKGIVPLRCVTLPPSTGLEEVEAIGFGVTLMKVDVLRKLHDPAGTLGHWFQTRWDDETQLHMGEDVYFCRLARRAGARVFVDHDLSKEVAHVGTIEYTIEHAQDHFTFENMPVPEAE